jgi:hypothetical protein
MQRVKIMDKIMKYGNVPILFLSMLLVLMVYDSSYSTTPFPCMTDRDCPRKKGFNVTCRKGFCAELKNYGG